MKSRPKIGLALGGGSARGMTYIGIFKVLEKHKIPIDYISGTSIGAIIGALFASGISAKKMEELILSTEWIKLLEPSDFKKGLITHERITKYLREQLGDKKFEDLEIPLAVTAVDINNGREVIFDSGDVVQAVNASMSIPGLFTPVQIGKHFYVDGGVIDPIPLGVLRRKNIDKIIAVDLSMDLEHYKFANAPEPEAKQPILDNIIEKTATNIKDYLKGNKIIPKSLLWAFNPRAIVQALQNSPSEIFQISAKSFSIMESELTRCKLAEFKPDVVIRPNIPNISLLDFHKYKSAIKKGEYAARKQLPAIKKLAGIK
ncbi:MAG: patatin-like phospholipase family protein [Nanoarchaeota archaeon]|nr:patatin-like phospholipase family protein [Nanoarchaeota archaeon]